MLLLAEVIKMVSAQVKAVGGQAAAMAAMLADAADAADAVSAAHGMSGSCCNNYSNHCSFLVAKRATVAMALVALGGGGERRR